MLTDPESCPSTATTAPRPEDSDFVGLEGKGGEILAKTLILLIKGIVMTIAYTFL